MRNDLIGFSGAYRYKSRQVMDRAIASAQAHLADEDLDEGSAWLRYFVSNGNVLTVNVNVPDSAEHRFAAANVFLILSASALEGAVEARRGLQTLDLFGSGVDD